ncbi:CCR4/NOT transcription complex subunit 3 [Vairimorpha necatrix]|uniref:CCR4/NOT transcription complex subunit 3 n=1 Tax=Vairimorpha necatrix TaxID=6039 RepID=A0AAX4JBU3_9MICR
MKRQEKTPNKQDKTEKLTPEQIWKNASLILGSKKKETSNNANVRPVEFSDIKSKISEITNQRVELLNEKFDNPKQAKEYFFETELKNSLFHIPDFNVLETVNTTKICEVPSYFPKIPLNIFDSPDIYKNLEVDTLFFIFYKNPNTIHQYHAATQLKVCSWRFHTKYLTWFQRLEEPKLITSDYERGDFLFFDYDESWNFMKKTDFTFEYKYLECAEF